MEDGFFFGGVVVDCSIIIIKSTLCLFHVVLSVVSSKAYALLVRYLEHALLLVLPKISTQYHSQWTTIPTSKCILSFLQPSFRRPAQSYKEQETPSELNQK